MTLNALGKYEENYCLFCGILEMDLILLKNVHINFENFQRTKKTDNVVKMCHI